KPLPPSSSTQVVSVFPQGIDGTAPVTIARGDTIADGLLKLGTALHDSNGARLEWSLVYVPVLPFDEAIDDPGRWRLVLSAWLPPESRPRALSPETEP
ncbi:MAG: hypothetical protein KDN19_23975, partial [Verrucomicrobiae bacterium]|nr:hypothetical protein [Verrucomicrobiae bacterium]